MKKEVIIYHNPRCSKSRETLKIIKEKGLEPRVVEYLKQVPTKDELKTLLMKLNLKAEDLLRKGEALYREQYKNLKLSEDEWIQVMRENPVLIERPVVVSGNRAVIGRPPEKVLELI